MPHVDIAEGPASRAAAAGHAKQPAGRRAWRICYKCIYCNIIIYIYIYNYELY